MEESVAGAVRELDKVIPLPMTLPFHLTPERRQLASSRRGCWALGWSAPQLLCRSILSHWVGLALPDWWRRSHRIRKAHDKPITVRHPHPRKRLGAHSIVFADQFVLS